MSRGWNSWTRSSGSQGHGHNYNLHRPDAARLMYVGRGGMGATGEIMKLEEIEAMLEAATPGPWKWRKDKSGDPYLLESLHKEPNKFAEKGYIHPDVLRINQYSVGWDGYDFDIDFNKDDHDARLIAAAPTIIKELVEQVRKLQRELDRAYNIIGENIHPG